jgi:hypothetical protein
MMGRYILESIGAPYELCEESILRLRPLEPGWGPEIVGIAELVNHAAGVEPNYNDDPPPLYRIRIQVDVEPLTEAEQAAEWAAYWARRAAAGEVGDG